ncbi:hypothetical protein CEY16_07525 [Halalkalibacillus sediminis]|uniref:Uncharacterized protein n=1 Tax=Halalkalibacillus sediminis TaxID=2018042 RepID=A0A2I0QTU2_9BACI|nr:HlyD family efflux transporter periplasmic adaptor subunit [Halalkalibacillus sediminis]PKR77772.1 hypothetical protein CEY16_07525 [Halalkalibacillus sediminis]
MKKKLWLLSLISLAMILTACNGDSSDNEEEQVETETPVEVSQVEVRDFTTTKSFTGRTMPSDQSPVIAQAPGEVEELFVEKGESVSEGDVLAEISSPQRGVYELEAGMDGIIQELNMREGRGVTSEEPAAMIISIDPLSMAFSVTARDANKFSVDDEVEFSISQLDYEGTATVTHVPATAGENGMFNIEAEAELPEDSEVTAGVTAQFYLEEVVEADAMVVPTEAVVDRGGERYVFKLEDGEAVRVPMEIASMQSSETAISLTEEDTLSEGDEVIVRGQLTLSDGQQVRIVEEAE